MLAPYHAVLDSCISRKYSSETKAETVRNNNKSIAVISGSDLCSIFVVAV